MALVNLPISLRQLSHELRTPLAGILGNAELLKDQKLFKWQQDCILDILQAGDNLLKWVNFLTELKELSDNNVAFSAANKKIKLNNPS